FDYSCIFFFFFSSRRRHTRFSRDWSSDVCSSDLSTPFEYGTPDNHVFHQYTLRLHGVDRDGLVKFLNENEIPCGVYYPIPLHKRSEERRVGKECRSRWSPNREHRNTIYIL